MPPGRRQTQLGGLVHYPTRSGGGRAKHPRAVRDDVHMSQTRGWQCGTIPKEIFMPTVTPQALARTVQDFLSEAAGAVVLENGAVAFDLAQSKYSISGEYNRCLLHLWSAERNAVRRVLDAEVKNGTLQLAVQRLGQARPSKLEICRERDRRSPTARRAARGAYVHKTRGK